MGTEALQHLSAALEENTARQLSRAALLHRAHRAQRHEISQIHAGVVPSACLSPAGPHGRDDLARTPEATRTSPIDARRCQSISPVMRAFSPEPHPGVGLSGVAVEGVETE